MDAVFAFLDPVSFALAMLIGLIAGGVKGIVGFGTPMILISGLSTLLAPEIALAALIFPALVSNGVQAFRQGWQAVVSTIRAFWVFLAVGGVMLLLSAQLVLVLPQSVLFIVIGAPVVLFAISQLFAKSTLTLPGRSNFIEVCVGAFAGCMGGLSGIWGPPTVAYLTAVQTPKADQIRVQGVIYGLGAVALLLAHTQSGVLRAQTLPLSLIMVVPVMVGMALGMRVQDRIDQAMFRKLTLFLLLLVGLNLVRRGLF